ncbi:MAG: hypothetical protein IJ551_06115, partial [Prevotella sp.]|nr:hypothetical protein [Prevotella sp.]
ALCLFLRFFVSSCSVKIRHSKLWDFQKAVGFVQKAPPFFQKGPGFEKKAAGFAGEPNLICDILFVVREIIITFATEF